VNTRTLDAIVASDFVNHHSDGAAHGVGALKDFVTRVTGIWPGLEIAIDAAFADETFADGARVGALVTLREDNVGSAALLICVKSGSFESATACSLSVGT
tara:strand:- start:1734 stop:2033 length:300 start_codon:yes stop_codon:yes gene_type:complete